MNRLNSIAFSYNHKKTTISCRPSLFHTIQYIQSMVSKLPSSSSSTSLTSSKSNTLQNVRKSKKPSISLPYLLSYTNDLKIKIDIHIEEILACLFTTTYITTPAVVLSLQSFSLNYFPSSSRISTESAYSSMNELHCKLGAIEIKTISTSQEILKKLTETIDETKSIDGLKIPLCSDKMVSCCNIELNSTITKHERISIDCISKSTNICLTYNSLNILLFVMDIFLKQFIAFREKQVNYPQSPSSSTVTSGTEPLTQSNELPTTNEIEEDMDNDEVFIQSILNDTLLPNDIDKLVEFNSIPDSQSISTTQPLTHTIQLDNIVEISDSDLEESEIINDPTRIPGSPPDEIFLSEEENQLSTSEYQYQFLPFFITDFTLHFYSMELQVSGYDSSKSTSYSVESILFSLTSKNIDCFDRIDESTAMFNRYGVPPVTSTLPVYQPIPSHTVEDHLSVITEIQPNSPSSPSLDRQISTLDLSLIPANESFHYSDDEATETQAIKKLQPKKESESPFSILPSRPVRRLAHPISSVMTNQYQRNSGIEYTVCFELNNLTVMGDEGPSFPKPQLPVYIPQIQINFPSFVLIALSTNQIPRNPHDISITYKKYPYQPITIGKYSGFKRGEESLFFLSSSSIESNRIQCSIHSLYVRLALGSIFVIYHSFIDFINLFKESSLLEHLHSLSTPKEKISKPTSSSSSFSSLLSSIHFQVMVTISRCNLTLHFTAEEGLFIYIDNISATYPDSTEFPLLSITNVGVSKVQGFTVVSNIISIDQIEGFSPAVYEALAVTHRLQESNNSIDEIRAKIYSNQNKQEKTTLVSEQEDNSSHRFVCCSTCSKHHYDVHLCNGYDNECNKYSSHVPDGVKPFVLIAGRIDCSQDSDYPWGTLIFDITTQWKAFKTLRKGDRKPVPYPSPDVSKRENVANHPAIDNSTIRNGYWLQVCVDEFYLRLNDVVPEVSPDLMEYCRVELVGINGVLNYNKILHSRGHFLQFMESMDEVKTPFDIGFDDVIGFHFHDLYVESFDIDFGESLPPLIVGSSIFGCGTLVFTELNRIAKYLRKDKVDLYCSNTFDSIRVSLTRSSIATKVFTNLAIQAKQLEVNWGDPLTVVRLSMVHCFDVLTPRGVGKSPKMVWYDKLRFMLHGDMSLRVSDLFRVNWLTNTQKEKKFESLTIDFINSTTTFYREGGVTMDFDEFSIGISHFKENELELKPIVIVDDSEWHIGLKWGNKDTKNHYVELNDAVSDIDRYYFYRSHTIEWTIELLPTSLRQFSSTLFIRVELIGFLVDFWNMIRAPSTRIDKDPGLMRNSTVFDVHFSLDNLQIWL